MKVCRLLITVCGLGSWAWNSSPGLGLAISTTFSPVAGTCEVPATVGVDHTYVWRVGEP